MDEAELIKSNQQPKIGINLKVDIDSKEKLSTYYTPGIGTISKKIAEDPETFRDLTWTKNNVAVVSDGSAVLGLGNIGPKGALPVMEGKSMLFKKFGGVDAVPIVIDTQDEQEIIDLVKKLAPSFGGINLEDITAPKCFVIEEALKEALDIPVFHDDQHGTAIVVLAGLINSAKLTERDLVDSKVVILGAGAAGVATANLLLAYGVSNILVVDSKGIISSDRDDLNKYKAKVAEETNPQNISGSFVDAIKNADIFIGVSGPGLVSEADVKSMAERSIVFALANPVPEIMPDLAKQAGAEIVATGRSDFANQVNNSLVFPGIFRGALDSRTKNITTEHMLSAAKVIAESVSELTAETIIPGQLQSGIAEAVAKVIK